MSRSQHGLPTKTIGGDNANSEGSLVKITAYDPWKYETTSSVTILPLLNTNTVEPRLTATSVIQSPRYNGHFFWPLGKNNHISCKQTLVNTVTSLLQPIFFGPLTGFHCKNCLEIIIAKSTVTKIYNLKYSTKSFLKKICLRGGSRGGVQGVRPPPPPWDDLRFSNTTGILRKKKGAEVEQETSAPHPKKNPGTAPVSLAFHWKMSTEELDFM